jgi:hypothetical protein
MTRPLQLPPSVWREARSLLIGETKRWWIMRRRLRLTVRVVIDSTAESSDWPLVDVPTLFRVEAFISNAEQPARMVWREVRQESIEAQIAVAKRWAESQADEMARRA